MKQSRTMSLVEAIANVIFGYGAAVVTQILVFPMFDLHMTWAENLKLATVFTFISIIRSFALRRLFEAIRTRKTERQTAARAGRRRQNPVVFRREFYKFDRDCRSSRR
jgi:hypothetical protein